MIPTLAVALRTKQREVYDAIRACADQRDVNVYLVGGAVRDWLMGQPAGDLDFTVEGDAIDFARALQSERGGEVLAHERFRTATWTYNGLHTDVTTARSEAYPRPAILPVVAPASIDVDLLRRDFSINAMALRLRDDALLDPLGGQTDLDRKLIRALHARSFIDDPTRILRAARYAARFGFDIEPSTRAWIDAGLAYLKGLSGERVKYDLELTFSIVQSAEALIMLREWSVFRALGIVVPEPEPLRARFATARAGLSDAQAWNLASLNLAPQEIIRAAGWGALIYNLGQMSASRWLDLIPYTTDVRDALVSLGVLSTLTAALFGGNPSRQSELLRSFSGIALLIVWLYDNSLSKRAAAFNEWHLWRAVQPVTTGDDLKARGVRPGPIYGKLLASLRSAWLDGEVTSAVEECALLERLLAEARE
jgi:tRNA nucleotidyltransferase (CCA-adding enzyme)